VFPEGPCSGRSHRIPTRSEQARQNTTRASTPFHTGYQRDRPTRSTNAIESLNYQLRKVTKARGSFPSDAAAMKLLYLAIRNINQKRGSTQGPGTHGWTQALNAFAIQFPDRLPL
jgi:transposase-like protein